MNQEIKKMIKLNFKIETYFSICLITIFSFIAIYNRKFCKALICNKLQKIVLENVLLFHCKSIVFLLFFIAVFHGFSGIKIYIRYKKYSNFSLCKMKRLMAIFVANPGIPGVQLYNPVCMGIGELLSGYDPLHSRGHTLPPVRQGLFPCIPAVYRHVYRLLQIPRDGNQDKKFYRLSQSQSGFLRVHV